MRGNASDSHELDPRERRTTVAAHPIVIRRAELFATRTHVLIIFGTRNVQRRGHPQPFQCPRCRTEQSGRPVTIRNWFTLYFVPVIPLQVVARYAQCEGCGTAFDQQVLDMGAQLASVDAPLNPSSALRDGMSIERVHRKLVEQGVDDVTARAKVDQAAGSRRKACVQCGETYHWSVDTCTACGGRLA